MQQDAMRCVRKVRRTCCAQQHVRARGSCMVPVMGDAGKRLSAKLSFSQSVSQAGIMIAVS